MFVIYHTYVTIIMDYAVDAYQKGIVTIINLRKMEKAV